MKFKKKGRRKETGLRVDGGKQIMFHEICIRLVEVSMSRIHNHPVFWPISIITESIFSQHMAKPLPSQFPKKILQRTWILIACNEVATYVEEASCIIADEICLAEQPEFKEYQMKMQIAIVVVVKCIVIVQQLENVDRVQYYEKSQKLTPLDRGKFAAIGQLTKKTELTGTEIRVEKFPQGKTGKVQNR